MCVCKQLDEDVKQVNLRKGNVLKKHSLHGENSSLGFIEAVHL